MKDERIENTMNRIAALGFFSICYLLLPISVLCRMLILKQHPSEFWDIIAIFFTGMVFLCAAYARAGFVPVYTKKQWTVMAVVIFVAVALTSTMMGHMHPLIDVGAMLIGLVPAMGLVIGVLHFLRRRWERKEAIQDEK